MKTNILACKKNRPANLQNADHPPSVSPVIGESTETLRQLTESGMAPVQVAELVFDAIRQEQFYVLPHPDWKPFVQKRMEDILQERDPI